MRIDICRRKASLEMLILSALISTVEVNYQGYIYRDKT